MNRISGYVCIATIDERVALFGAATEQTDCVCENFEGNGLVPLRSRRVAEQARAELRRRFNRTKVRIAHITLTIAESVSEWARLTRSRSLIVVFESDWGKLLIGRLVPGCPSQSPVPGARLVENGFQPLRTFELAKYVACEWARQGQSRAYISSFRLIQRRSQSRSS